VRVPAQEIEQSSPDPTITTATPPKANCVVVRLVGLSALGFNFKVPPLLFCPPDPIGQIHRAILNQNPIGIFTLTSKTEKHLKIAASSLENTVLEGRRSD
jgi:hypothetical protein